MMLKKEDKQEIVKLRKEGYTIVWISKKFGITRKNVYQVLNRYKMHGEKSFEKSLLNKKYSPEFKLEVIERINSGESKNSICIEYRISHAMILKWLQDYEENGYNGLITKKRGRQKMEKEKKEKEISHLNDEERQELIELRAKNKYLEMENEYLKKLDALVRQRLKQKRKKKSK